MNVPRDASCRVYMRSLLNPLVQLFSSFATGFAMPSNLRFSAEFHAASATHQHSLVERVTLVDKITSKQYLWTSTSMASRPIYSAKTGPNLLPLNRAINYRGTLTKDFPFQNIPSRELLCIDPRNEPSTARSPPRMEE